MTLWVEDELVDCMICEAPNPAEAILCGKCSAPMALVHDTAEENREPRIISVVGESNVGKTVYLGFLLDMLSRCAKDFEAVPKGPYSIDLQQNVVSYMSNRMFPPKTPMEPNQWYWAYYKTRRKRRKSKWVDLVMPDMAGEALAAEVATPQTFTVIRNLLNKSAGTLMLVDAGLAANGASRPDFFALKMLSYIDAMHSNNGEQRLRKPIGVVLCKSDFCPESFDDPQRFVEANLNRLWNLCQSRFANVRFFACSAVGSLAYATSGGAGSDRDYVQPIPLHTALHGIMEPFEWIIDQI